MPDHGQKKNKTQQDTSGLSWQNVLPRDARQSVTEGLDSYAMTGKGDVNKLSGREGDRLDRS
jgi:hypothetical protein